MARAIERISSGGPKVIALDVLYTDPTAVAEDAQLSKSLATAGNVVVEEGLSTSLLGMSFLSELKSWQTTPAGLVLKQ